MLGLEYYTQQMTSGVIVVCAKAGHLCAALAEVHVFRLKQHCSPVHIEILAR
jgi:hypothetical protein